MSPEERESLFATFAVHAMQGIISTNTHFVRDPKTLAKKSFEFAEEMLKEYDCKRFFMKGVNK